MAKKVAAAAAAQATASLGAKLQAAAAERSALAEAKRRRRATKQAKQQAKTNALIKQLMTQVTAARHESKATKKINTNKVIKSTKNQLKVAQRAQLKAEAKAFATKRKLLAIKRRQAELLRTERKKCAGKCDREFPVLVGPKNIRNTETRSVVVIGDRDENKKVWSRVNTPRKWDWNPKSLKRTSRHIKKAGARITKAHKLTKRISEAPLVEKPL